MGSDCYTPDESFRKASQVQWLCSWLSQSGELGSIIEIAYGLADSQQQKTYSTAMHNLT